MNEITADELFEGLLGFGLFADKIPPFLTGEEFFNYVKTLTLPIATVKEKDYIRYSNMRNINVPRPLSIPHPFAYANLCKTLANNWGKIQKHFDDKTKKDKHKISRIHIRKQKGSKILFQMNYKNEYDDGVPENNLIIGSRYIAYADISNCFPSMYSHAIAWALITKKCAKTSKNPGLWFNEIDFYSRNIKQGETNGFLIGPHSSNLLSEVILVAVDEELTKKKFKYVRYIDDYRCYVSTHEEAENFFVVLSEELKKYELTLNHKKSKISSLPQPSDKVWKRKLNHFYFTPIFTKSKKKVIRIKELQAFMDLAIDLMLENSDTAVLNYAIKTISNKYLGADAIEYYIKQIHHLILLYPYLINILEKSVFEPFKIGDEKIKEMAIDIYKYGINNKFYEACSFSLYWALKYGFNLKSLNLKNDSIESDDCIFMLIAYLHDKKHMRPVYLKEYREHAKLLKKDDYDRFWAFIYEALPWSDQKDEFKIMKTAGISFLKTEFK